MDAKPNIRRRIYIKTRVVEEFGKSLSIPPLQHIIQSYDTAFSKKETADYSAITTWGVFLS